jgi:hypothetical protein
MLLFTFSRSSSRSAWGCLLVLSNSSTLTFDSSSSRLSDRIWVSFSRTCLSGALFSPIDCSLTCSSSVNTLSNVLLRLLQFGHFLHRRLWVDFGVFYLRCDILLTSLRFVVGRCQLFGDQLGLEGSVPQQFVVALLFFDSFSSRGDSVLTQTLLLRHLVRLDVDRRLQSGVAPGARDFLVPQLTLGVETPGGSELDLRLNSQLLGHVRRQHSHLFHRGGVPGRQPVPRSSRITPGSVFSGFGTVVT